MVFEILSFKDIEVMTLTHWTHNVWFSIGALGGQFEPTISHIVETLSFKDFAVTTLTFWGHVTSSVT